MGATSATGPVTTSAATVVVGPDGSGVVGSRVGEGGPVSVGDDVAAGPAPVGSVGLATTTTAVTTAATAALVRTATPTCRRRAWRRRAEESGRWVRPAAEWAAAVSRRRSSSSYGLWSPMVRLPGVRPASPEVGIVLKQLRECGSAAGQPHLDRSDRRLGLGCDLGDREVVQLVEHPAVNRLHQYRRLSQPDRLHRLERNPRTTRWPAGPDAPVDRQADIEGWFV